MSLPSTNQAAAASLVALAAVLAGGCGSSKPESDERTLPEIAMADDLNPDPSVLEITLEARPTTIEYLPGKQTAAWSYNGTVPGPLIDADVGDELVVHFTNNLPEPTTIHWHGVRLPAAMDGTTAMQNPILPGATFTYRFILRDAGLFWFHPHVRADDQVERGLYGLIRVKESEVADLGTERVIALDDVLLNADGSLVSQESIGAAMQMTGRQGNVLLANGVQSPSLRVAQGQRTRLRLVNVANSRYFRLKLSRGQLTLIGVDGGHLERPLAVPEVLLSPGERVDVLIEASGAEGDLVELVNEPYDRGHQNDGGPPATVLSLRMTAERSTSTALPDALRVIAPSPTPSMARRLVLSESEGTSASGPVFEINGEAFPNVTPLQTSLGTSEEWEVVNSTEMDHPFHLHGYFFQVTERNGVPEAVRAWKDTVNVPRQQTLKFRVAFLENPGRWMYHCHILEHGERGMMGELDVSP